jgi:hypothetical protein
MSKLWSDRFLYPYDFLGHRRYDCPEERNFTQTLICRICGLAGHVDRDCKDRNNPEVLQAAHRREQMLNSEYNSLMTELGAPKNAYNPQQGYAAQAWMGANPMIPGMYLFLIKNLGCLLNYLLVWLRWHLLVWRPLEWKCLLEWHHLVWLLLEWKCLLDLIPIIDNFFFNKNS